MHVNFLRGASGPLRMSGLVAMGLGLWQLLFSAAGWSGGASRVSTPDPLAGVRAGHWTHLHGTVQSDSSALCTEIKVVPGDFLDDDWEVKGIVGGIDTSRRRFAIGPLRVQVGDKTSFDDPDDDLEEFSDLRRGMLVDVDGTYSKNRVILATEVDNEDGPDERRSWPTNHIQILGKVERVDPRRRLIWVLGIAFQVTDRTRLKTVIR